VCKIILRISGGLGNQLFSYAAARRLALINNAELVIDNVSGFSYDTLYRRQYQLNHFNISCRIATSAERLEPLSRLRRYIKRKWSQRKPFEYRRYVSQEMIDFDPRLLHIQTSGVIYLEGYWQSENYFKDVEDSIRDDLKIMPPTDDLNLIFAKKINSCNAVSVHLRFFDEPDSIDLNNISANYYIRAIAAMENINPDAHYFIFSDQPTFAHRRIPLPSNRITIVAHNHGDDGAYADLWLMAQCKHFIIANSTFSWWGAWLSTNLIKTVITPAFELRQGKMQWGFRGLIPEGWIKL
jgi:hypothetical protein